MSANSFPNSDMSSCPDQLHCFPEGIFITGHGAVGLYQSRFFNTGPVCSCGTPKRTKYTLFSIGSRSNPHGGDVVPSLPGQHWCTTSKLDVLIVLGWGCCRNTVHLSRVPSGRAIETLIYAVIDK
ncbi:hypothetical protein CEXT_767581 [Caerostris extrusa]|uniref:Uncharacterized protein n=1 Tax=Caerostris extrusa TaxID=172846 RepID=A0AAV4WKE7_CAEEX|nr:hypothetical protein CEXT_767581 [Caerostris extrusa]